MTMTDSTTTPARAPGTVPAMVRPFPADKELPRRTVDCMPAYDAIPQEFKRQSKIIPQLTPLLMLRIH